ncbi:MAG: alpha/beta fold hydrolase [Planctomycetota bacterium]
MVSSAFPYTGHFLWRGSHRLHYIDEGNGPPIVMVHGNPTWSYYYRRLIAALSDRYRVIAIDHMGCGRSDRPDDSEYDYRLANRVADLTALLDHLGLDRDITMVVHDWGGMIGMGYATQHPERIGRLVILNTAAFHLPADKRFPLSLRLARAPGLGALLVRGANLFCWSVSHFGCRRRLIGDAVREQFLAPYQSWAARRAVHRFVEDIPLKPSDPSYALVSEVERGLERLRHVPMQIFWGARDFVFDDAVLRRWIAHFPTARVRRFVDCGHFVLEDAFEEILPELTTFLELPAN